VIGLLAKNEKGGYIVSQDFPSLFTYEPLIVAESFYAYQTIPHMDIAATNKHALLRAYASSSFPACLHHPDRPTGVKEFVFDVPKDAGEPLVGFDSRYLPTVLRGQAECRHFVLARPYSPDFGFNGLINVRYLSGVFDDYRNHEVVAPNGELFKPSENRSYTAPVVLTCEHSGVTISKVEWSGRGEDIFLDYNGELIPIETARYTVRVDGATNDFSSNAIVVAIKPVDSLILRSPQVTVWRNGYSKACSGYNESGMEIVGAGGSVVFSSRLMWPYIAPLSMKDAADNPNTYVDPSHTYGSLFNYCGLLKSELDIDTDDYKYVFPSMHSSGVSVGASEQSRWETSEGDGIFTGDTDSTYSWVQSVGFVNGVGKSVDGKLMAVQTPISLKLTEWLSAQTTSGGLIGSIVGGFTNAVLGTDFGLTGGTKYFGGGTNTVYDHKNDIVLLAS
jgi:hypothetical protein